MQTLAIRKTHKGLRWNLTTVSLRHSNRFATYLRKASGINELERFLHSINTERLHRRAGKPCLSLSLSLVTASGRYYKTAVKHCFTSPSPPLPLVPVPFPSFTQPSVSRSGEKRSRFRTMRKRCTCERIDVSPVVDDDGGGIVGIVGIVVVVVVVVVVVITREAPVGCTAAQLSIWEPMLPFLLRPPPASLPPPPSPPPAPPPPSPAASPPLPTSRNCSRSCSSSDGITTMLAISRVTNSFLCLCSLVLFLKRSLFSAYFYWIIFVDSIKIPYVISCLYIIYNSGLSLSRKVAMIDFVCNNLINVR